MNFKALEKSIRVLEKSWKFFSEKGYEPCGRKSDNKSSLTIQFAIVLTSAYIL